MSMKPSTDSNLDLNSKEPVQKLVHLLTIRDINHSPPGTSIGM